MSPRPRIAALLALLHAQRDEVERRAALERDTKEWIEASEILDEINAQIMHLAEFGTPRREAIGNGDELDLDSRPVGDVAFRRCVVDSVRKAAHLAAQDRIVNRTTTVLLDAEERIARAEQLIADAQQAIRNRYPNATVEGQAVGSPDGFNAELYTIRADREGQVA
jgi:hypothetical protein